jgi:hypothetical protein
MFHTDVFLLDIYDWKLLYAGIYLNSRQIKRKPNLLILRPANCYITDKAPKLKDRGRDTALRGSATSHLKRLSNKYGVMMEKFGEKTSSSVPSSAMELTVSPLGLNLGLRGGNQL